MMAVEMCRTKHVLHAPDSEPPLDARGYNEFTLVILISWHI